jgi:acyl carrier protein
MTDVKTDELMLRLCTFAAEQVNVDPSTVTPDSHFYNDLNFDSLDLMEYSMRIEEEFDVSVPDEAAEKVRTPRQAYQLLAGLKAAPPA